MVEKIFGLIGAGGYGREVMPLARNIQHGLPESRRERIVFVMEGLPSEKMVNDVPVMSLTEFLSYGDNATFNVAIGDSRVRQRIAEQCLDAGLRPSTIAAANVVNMDFNEIGIGAILSPFVTITSNAKIGQFFHANIYSYVAHDCVVGDYVTFAPGVKCNGNVHICDHAYIGTGAILKQGTHAKPLVIGAGAVVGMGAVVTKDVPDNAVVVGNPAKTLIKS